MHTQLYIFKHQSKISTPDHAQTFLSVVQGLWSCHSCLYFYNRQIDSSFSITAHILRVVILVTHLLILALPARYFKVKQACYLITLVSWYLITLPFFGRLFNHIQPASKLSNGCDYSIFKVSQVAEQLITYSEQHRRNYQHIFF